MMNVQYIKLDDVVQMNKALIQMYSPEETHQLVSYSLLGSAVYRPQQTLLGEDAYPTLFEKAAVLLESIAQNHCFANANKRTAWAACGVFLNINGYELLMDTGVATDLVVNLVTKKIDTKSVAILLKMNSYKK